MISSRRHQLLHLARRAQSTSTMAIYANAPHTEKTATLSSSTKAATTTTTSSSSNIMKSSTAISTHRSKQEFSTAVSYDSFDDNDYLFEQQMFTFANTTSDLKAFGLETDPIEAAALAKSDNMFDKVILFISHGETRKEEYEEGVVVNPSLSGEGIGHALNISREIATYCNKSTGLVPQLYVVSPLRCTTESALLAFPQYAPGNIHNMPWICNTLCVENYANYNVEDLENDFPGVDYSSLKQQSNHDDFLSWLNQRDERVIVVSSTESWINQFIDTFAPTKTSEDSPNRRILRTVAIKFN